MRRFRSSTIIVVAALIGVLARSAGALAAPQQLDCVLTDTGTQPGSESRPITVVFDDEAKTLTVQDSSQNYSFASVSISNVSISGVDQSVSLGIDRSSLGIVWQKYGATEVATEYGRCRPADHAAAAATH